MFRKESTMPRGRPPLGPDLVEHCDADPNTKRRLHVLLQTIAGELSVPDACQQLDISQTRFFELRAAMLQSALDSLSPKPAGRPAQHVDPAQKRIGQLEQQIQDLRVHLAAAQLREEIALAMPGIYRRPKHPGKKTTRPTRQAPNSNPTRDRKTQYPNPSTNGSDVT
jgi:hypothetical protein